ncbi:MAG: hypothetical protein VYA67_21785 [Actinomycetota bacterium]|nr:hypothetical protein [Actinomycetota bacterium]
MMLRVLGSWQLWILVAFFLVGLALFSAEVPPPGPVCETVCDTTGELP